MTILYLILYFTILVFSFYYFTIIYIRFWWKRNIVSDKFDAVDIPFVTVIIIGRNEGNNISTCINSILDNDYPTDKFEVIYIDDHSEDDSIQILSKISDPNFCFYRLESKISHFNNISFKKVGIDFAVSKARGSIILQTDADVIAKKDWIRSHSVYFQNTEKVELVTGPVIYYETGSSVLSSFQYYDLLTMIAVTSAGINTGKYFLSNGANMIYRKEIYNIDSTNLSKASGDDMFFSQGIGLKNKDAIRFNLNPDALIKTFPEKDLKDFFNQRLRWGTKTSSYKDYKLRALIILVFIVNFLILTDFFLFLFFSTNFLYYLFLLVSIKFALDINLIVSVAKYYKMRYCIPQIIISLLLYPYYISIIGTASLLITNYSWKGRLVK